MFGRAPSAQSHAAGLPIVPDDWTELASSLKSAAQGGHAVAVEARLAGTSGRWVRITPIAPNSPAPSGQIICIITEITHEKRIEQELMESQRQLSTLINNLPGIAYRCEPKEPWHLTFVSRGVEELTGYSRTDFIRGHVSWAKIVHPEDLDRVGEVVDAGVSSDQMFQVSYRIVTKEGSVRWVQERGRAIKNDGGEIVCLEGFIGDITDAKVGGDRAHWLANHDPLTGLPNRLFFQEELQRRTACTGANQPFAVLLFDLDDFKRINDTLGHDAGDELLVSAAQRLEGALPKGSVVARLGGDEFAAILDGNCSEEGVEAGVASVLEALRRPVKLASQTVDCSASIGASLFPLHGRSSTELLKNADIALYSAKAAGRDGLQLFQPHMREPVKRRSVMISQAREAFDGHRILPCYQPKVRLSSGMIGGFEALLRWRRGSGALRGPDELAAALDDCTLSPLLGARMLSLVIADMRRWADEGFEFDHVAVNTSPVQLRRGDFANVVLDCLAASNVHPSKLQIEVTESVFLGRGVGAVEKALSELSKQGVTIALDDFGTGHASLTHLTQFPVNALKIDRSFVQRLCSSKKAQAITQSVIQLGLNLDMEIVAEGVETAEQEELLRAAGCTYGQGYLYSPAVAGRTVPSLGHLCGSMRSMF
jgi:diguanylate cyclase (GGDEF)-like protein/PAS domain S-box-containing protein